MSIVRLQVLCPPELADPVVGVLRGRPGVVAIVRGSTEAADTATVTAHLARESADTVVTELAALGVGERGMITIDTVGVAFGRAAERAEQEAPGEGDDAVVWEELIARTGGDSRLTGVLLAFMVLATLLASIGVVTNSPITTVGGMVLGPEFGPLAALAVGLVRRQAAVARRGAIALVVGFPFAVVVTGLLALLARAVGLIHPGDLSSNQEVDFVYHPGWFSLIIALVAGAAGMLSLMSTRSAALIGVFISVTTIPAAGNAAVAGVLGRWDQTGESLLQLLINLVGIVVAGVITLTVRGGLRARRVDDQARRPRGGGQRA
jgi:uncharacterized hydrophobic protein (TIGR00271 family)